MYNKMKQTYEPITPEEKQQIVNDYCNSISLSELLAGQKKNEFEHLRFIFKNNLAEVTFGKDEFLLVNMDGYRKVVLNDLNYFDNAIHMEIRDCKTGRIEKTAIDINHTGFKFIMISWADLQEMIFNQCKSTYKSDDLLELEE